MALASLDHNTGRDEPLHQVAVVWADIRFVERDPQRLECACQLAEISEPAGIDAEDGLLVERLQTELLYLQALQVCQLGLCRRPVAGRQEGDRALPGQKHLLRPLVGGQPVFNLGALWEIAPVAGEEEAPEFGVCEG